MKYKLSTINIWFTNGPFNVVFQQIKMFEIYVYDCFFQNIVKIQYAQFLRKGY